MLHRKITPFATCIFLATLMADALHAQDADYYYFKDEQIKIRLLKDVKAFWVPGNQKSRDLGIAASAAADINRALVQLDLPRTRDRYGIEVYQQRAGVSDAQFDRAIRQLTGAFASAREAPVYEFRNTRLILTDTYTVEFDTDAIGGDSDTKLKERLEKLLGQDPKLRVTRDKNRPEQRRFKVTFPTIPPRDALSQINRLNREPDIDAYPDFIRFRELKVWLDQLNKIKRIPSTSPLRLCLKALAGQPPADPAFDKQWGLHNYGNTNAGGTCQSGFPHGVCDADIDWFDAWAGSHVGQTPEEPIIAVLDVGVQSHSDLRLEDPGINVTNSGTWKPLNDDNRHGTNVAGIAAAITDNCSGISGVAPSARILSVRISSIVPGTESAWEEFADEAGDGIRDAADAGARVLINSWWLKEVPDTDVYNQVESAVTEHDAVVVFAAGNISLLSDCDQVGGANVCDSDVQFPATLANDANACISGGVLAVSASTQGDRFKTVEFYADAPAGVISQAGSGKWGSRHGPAITAISVAAPGTDIYTTDTGNQIVSNFFGTSAAAPFVGGAAAAILTRHPTASAYQVKDWIQRSADPGPVNVSNPNEYFGHGRLNINEALALAETEMGMSPPPTPGVGCP